VRLGFDENLLFTEDVETTALTMGSGASIIATFPSTQGTYAVVTSGRKLQVLDIPKTAGRPTLVHLRKAGQELATDAVNVAGGAYYYSASEETGVNFNKVFGSFELPQGDFGVTQIFLVP
jgi:hypothetical protein